MTAWCKQALCSKCIEKDQPQHATIHNKKPPEHANRIYILLWYLYYTITKQDKLLFSVWVLVLLLYIFMLHTTNSHWIYCKKFPQQCIGYLFFREQCHIVPARSAYQLRETFKKGLVGSGPAISFLFFFYCFLPTFLVFFFFT